MTPLPLLRRGLLLPDVVSEGRDAVAASLLLLTLPAQPVIIITIIIIVTWVLKTRLIEKKYPSSFLKPNFWKLHDDSKNVCLKSGANGLKS